jgi:hypothetical protein
LVHRTSSKEQNMSVSPSDASAMLITASVMDPVNVDRRTTAKALPLLSQIALARAATRSRYGAGGLCSLVQMD